jgi:hypothetical protein
VDNCIFITNLPSLFVDLFLFSASFSLRVRGYVPFITLPLRVLVKEKPGGLFFLLVMMAEEEDVMVEEEDVMVEEEDVEVLCRPPGLLL